MAKWNVTGVVTGGKYLGEYEAETAEQAIATALMLEGGGISLCNQCSGECEDGAVDEAIASLSDRKSE